MSANEDYATYRDAYQFGYDSLAKNPDKKFEDIETDLGVEWHSKPDRQMNWDRAKDAAKDSYNYANELYKDRAKKA